MRFPGWGTRVGSQTTGGDAHADIGRSFQRGPESRGARRARCASSRPRSPTCAAGSPTPRPAPAGSSSGSPTPSARWPRSPPRTSASPQTLREARDQIMKLKEEVDRLAQPPAGFGTFLDPQRRRLGRRVHRRPQAAGQRQPRRSTLDALRRGQEVMLNEALNVVAAFDFEEVGEVVMFKELLADGERALVIANADEERVVRLAEPLRDEHDPGRRLAAARLRAPATSTRRSRSPRSRSWSSRRSRTSTTSRHRRPRRPDRADPRRRRAAVPAPRAVQGARAQAAEGRAALRPARLRQDADRQGGRQLAGQEGRSAKTGAGGEVLLPQHQGPRAAQQVRRRDRAAHPAGLPAGPGEGQRGHARSSCSSTRWTRCSAPAAPASPPTSRTPSSRSCSARSTASSGSRTSSSSAPPTART